MNVQGVGIGMRSPHLPELLETDRALDFVEIIPENYVGRGGRAARHLAAARERWPVLVHGVSMSLGGPDPLDRDWITGLKGLLDQIEAPFYTDHLCYTSLGGFESHQLLPLPYHAEAVRHAAGRIRELRARLDRPVAVENISFYAFMPGSDMTHTEFVTAVCEEADCGLLLDVNNLYVNSANHGLDARAELDRLPLERVVQLHIAGHTVTEGRVIDSHGAPTAPGVLDLFREVARRLGPVPTLLERDQNIPPLAEVLDEADAIRAVQRQAVA